MPLKVEITAAAALLLTAAGTGPAHAGAALCRPSEARTLISNAYASLYTRRGALYGCANGREEPVTLAFARTFYRPPVMALAGTMSAIVINDSANDFPYIQALDLGPSGYRVVLRRPEERIGSLRIRSDGALAFIACPPGSYDAADPPISPGTRCKRPSQTRNTVYVALPHRQLRRIVRAVQIDPASLRMSDTTLSWRQSGKRRRVLYRDSGSVTATRAPAPSST